MDIRHIARAGLVVMAAVLLVTFAFAAAPTGAPVAVKAAFAQEAAAPVAAPAAAATAAGTAESAEPKAEEAKEGAAAEGEAKAEKKEIPHVVGKPSPAQLQDLRYAWASIPGFDLLLVAILGLVVTVGIIGFGVFKQMRV